MMEMSSNLSAYYELLMQREQANSKLLYNLKDNFSSIMQEFMRNYKVIKQYQGYKQYYEIEKEKAEKEKDVLKLELEMLKIENNRLKGMNPKKEEGQRRGSPLGREIQETIMEEKNLMDLLQQRENFILFMKEKENKYISLLNAIEARGVNIDRIYEEEVNQNHTEGDGISTDFALLPSRNSGGSLTESSDDVLLNFETEGEKRDMRVSQFHHQQNRPRKPQRRVVHKEEDYKPMKSQENFWAQRQFTEASNSRTMTSYSESAFQSSSNHEQSLYKFIDSTPLDMLNNQDLAASVGTKGSKKLPPSEQSPAMLKKDQLKLDLSALQQKVIKQYQDEFMEKWAEFTSSWKRAIEKDKTFQPVTN